MINKLKFDRHKVQRRRPPIRFVKVFQRQKVVRRAINYISWLIFFPFPAFGLRSLSNPWTLPRLPQLYRQPRWKDRSQKGHLIEPEADLMGIQRLWRQQPLEPGDLGRCQFDGYAWATGQGLVQWWGRVYVPRRRVLLGLPKCQWRCLFARKCIQNTRFSASW